MEATQEEKSSDSKNTKADTARNKSVAAGEKSEVVRENSGATGSDAMAADYRPEITTEDVIEVSEDSEAIETKVAGEAKEYEVYESCVDERIVKLEKQLIEAQSLAEERLGQLQRYSAELENVQKRTDREKRELIKYASETLVKRLLSVLDSLERASSHDEGAIKIYQQLLDILEDEGLSPIPAKGEKFDPYKHEALMKVKSVDLEEDTIAEELQRGYTLNSKVIRFSKVSVVGR